MPRKIRFGVLSPAKIAVKKVIPAMQQCERCEITAIASRNLASAQKAANELGIPNAFGSYEELLADPDIDAVYIPLPNDLHVPWTIRAARAGKHVLCEKPIALNADEARTLLAVQQETGKVIAEAFMVKLHPQWERTRDIIQSGEIGPLRLVTGTFSFFNDDPANIRNQPQHGGGALLDIGCYLVFTARELFGKPAAELGQPGTPAEPTRVMALIDRDPKTSVDRFDSFILQFPEGQAIFSCSTQLVSSQRIEAFGTTGRIEIPIPFNTPPDRRAEMLVDLTGDFLGTGIRPETFSPENQYTLQGDAFARAILHGTPPPVPLDHAIANMAVLDAIVRSAETGQWEQPR